MFKNILIVGCGLIGSSILRASLNKKASKNFFVYEKSKKNIREIKKINKKIIILNKLDNKISDMDFVIIATPMSQYERVIPHLNKYLTKKSLITDVGSTKENISKLKKNSLSNSLDWIMSHPISGSEVSGPKYGSKSLFVNKWCIIFSDKNKIKQKKLVNFWKKIGSKVIIMDEKVHDKIFSITSHLPHLIAYNLIKTAQDFQKTQKNDVIKFSAGGLRDFSRIAASNEVMWRDIFFNNKNNIVRAINLFIKNLKSFKKNIENLDDKTLRKKLVNSKKVRQQILNLKQDIAKPDFGRDQN
jgi:prephenate dehydrogenase/cyclohexadieny/prephenate dehydrogenase